nr:hypothetical protein CFP56_35044 [Quercus suber]
MYLDRASELTRRKRNNQSSFLHSEFSINPALSDFTCGCDVKLVTGSSVWENKVMSSAFWSARALLR